MRAVVELPPVKLLAHNFMRETKTHSSQEGPRKSYLPIRPTQTMNSDFVSLIIIIYYYSLGLSIGLLVFGTFHTFFSFLFSFFLGS